jgi:hypothetical protein
MLCMSMTKCVSLSRGHGDAGKCRVQEKLRDGREVFRRLWKVGRVQRRVSSTSG